MHGLGMLHDKITSKTGHSGGETPPWMWE